MLRDWSLRYATALTTALFLVMAVSGVALFFRLQTVAFKELHAWLGLVLVTASGLHLWRNWPAMLGYIRRGALKYPLIAALTASSAFAYAGLTAPSKTDPNRQLTAMFARAHLTEIAPLLHVDAEEIARKLRNRGFEVASTGQSLTEIAKASGRNENEVIKTVGDDLASQRAGLKAE